jgi:lysophospholipase L1-like esterase
MTTPLQTNHKIICLGDSITFGYPFGPAFSWVNQLCDQGLNLVNRGVNGDTTSNMLHRFNRDVLALAPTHVHILGGTNDAWLAFDPEESQYNICKMIELSLEHGIQPVIGLTTPICSNPVEGNSFFPFGTDNIKAWLSRFRKWLKDYATLHNIPLIDYYTPLCLPGTGEGDARYFYDEGHLNHDGNATMAVVAAVNLKRGQATFHGNYNQ